MQSDNLKKPDNAWAAIWAFIGTLTGVVLAQCIISLAKRRRIISQKSLMEKELQRDKQLHQPPVALSHTDDRKGQASSTFENVAQCLVPEIYLGVVTVVQGVTIGILGETFLEQGLQKESGWTVWVLAIVSLAIILIYWFEFMMGYLYLFRIIQLSALMHVVITTAYFVIGLCQIVMCSVIHDSYIWFGTLTAMVVMVTAYSLLMNRVVKHRPFAFEPLGNHIEQDHFRLIRVRFAALLSAVVLWIVSTKSQEIAVVSILIVSIYLAVDAIKEFNIRQQIAQRTPADNAFD